VFNTCRWLSRLPKASLLENLQEAEQAEVYLVVTVGEIGVAPILRFLSLPEFFFFPLGWVVSDII
jgi:hypothetical protein